MNILIIKLIEKLIRFTMETTSADGQTGIVLSKSDNLVKLLRF